MNKMVQSASTLAEFILHIGLKKPYKTSIYHSLHGLANANSKCNRPIIWRFRMVYTRFGISIKLANFQNEFNYILMSAAIMQQYAIEMMYVWFVTVPGRFAPNPVRPPLPLPPPSRVVSPRVASPSFINSALKNEIWKIPLQIFVFWML